MKVFSPENLGQLIDSTEEEFRQFCKGKNIGYLKSLHNLLCQTYHEVSFTNNALVEKTSKLNEDAPEYAECKKTLEGLFSKLLRIEQRVVILKELTKSLELTN